MNILNGATNILMAGGMGTGKSTLIDQAKSALGVSNESKVLLSAIDEVFRQGSKVGQPMPLKYGVVYHLNRPGWVVLSSGDRDGTPLGLVEQVMELNANGLSTLTERRNFGAALRPTYARLLADKLGADSIVFAILRVPRDVHISRVEGRRERNKLAQPNRVYKTTVEELVDGEIQGQIRVKQIAVGAGFNVVDIPYNNALGRLLELMQNGGK